MALPRPNFIDRDAQTIINEMVADYEARVGKTLQPAQVERLLINAFAYRELLIRNQIQYAAEQNLVEYATYPTLDYLAALVSVTRLAASPATCTLEFSIVDGHTGVVIPALTRVASADGKVYFATVESVSVAIGVYTVTVQAYATPDGIAGNNYDIGAVNELLDPLAFVESVTNTNATGGGASQETDEALRARIKAAPNAYSNAGSRGAYEFWAISAHPSILDVAAESSTPGQVDVYVLVDGGTAPTQVLDAVDAQLSAETIRPLTDTVVVSNPTKTDYTIEVNITTYDTADDATVSDLVGEALTSYVAARKNKLGLDVVIAQLVKTCVAIDGVYNCVVVSPVADIVLTGSAYANNTSIIVNLIGSENG